MAVKVLTHEQACALYDAGVREIAASNCHFNDTEAYWIVEERAKAGKWEPNWLDPQGREYRVAALTWTYCIEVE